MTGVQTCALPISLPVADLQRDIAASSAEVDEAAKEDLALPPVAPFCARARSSDAS